MNRPTQIGIPTFVRIKPGTLDRLGIYAARHTHRRIVMISSAGIVPELVERVRRSLTDHGAESIECLEAADASFENASSLFTALSDDCQAVIGLGGGRALDVAKYVAFLARRPYYAVPTSLSNDGFCSPQVSFTLGGRRVSLAAALPFAVVVDTEVCRQAPEVLWLSGVGDLVAKITAVKDWKLAYHHRGESVNDFAALLSDATVLQFLGRPERDLEGIQTLATALMLNGIAMEICGSSRPASGAEHLISHALDELSQRPRLHGLQVGVATYLVSHLQNHGSERIASVFDQTGFWRAIEADPFDRSEWLQAAERAPQIRSNRFTVLTICDAVKKVARLIDQDERLRKCFRS
jgi:glycerol-1-phosphate dehydrogenase [NAD(P)+]